MLLDEIKGIDANDREVRLALLASKQADFDKLFPEYQPVQSDDEADFADEEDEVKYIFTNAEYDPKAVEAEIKEMMERAASDSIRFDNPAFG
jgi:hypothetical protein